MKYYEISEETARLSHNMMSMTSYKPGSATAEYRAAVDAAAELVERQKKSVSPFYHDKLDTLLDRYARRLAEWTNARNRNGASCPSVLVCGPANFPVRKKEKQIAREDALWREYNEIKGLLDKIKRTGTGPIDFSDPHAREMLVERVESAKAIHARHLEANAYYRKHKTLDGCPGVEPKEREWLTRPGVFARGDGSPLALYGVPFPPYALQSDNAAIKRYTERLQQYDKMHAQQDGYGSGGETEFDGGRMVYNIAGDRLQIFFDEIPGDETRATLNKHGFHWSRKNQAWQRKLTRNAVYDARRILNIPAPAKPPAVTEEGEGGTQAATPATPAEPDTPDGQALFPLA